jgi:uncharacterized membrane protein YphA (DoxX/SURF4 family)
MTDIAAENAPPKTRTAAALAGRGTELLVGGVFLIFAILKALNVNLFIVSIGDYGVLHDASLQTAAALGTLAVETILGVALILGFRPRALTLGATALLLLVFSGLIVYGWAFHDLEDCGCGGSIRMGPGVSLLKNAGLLALCGIARWGLGRRSGNGGDLVKGLLATVLGLGVTAYAYAQVEPPPPPAPPPGESATFAQFSFTDADGIPWDLSQGDYFIAMLSATCDHCRASVPALNDLGRQPGMPPIIGLCEGNETTLEDFRIMTAPEFPTHLIPTRVFGTLDGNAPPRFYAVRDGKELRHWDDEVPAWEEVQAALATGAAPETL